MGEWNTGIEEYYHCYFARTFYILSDQSLSQSLFFEAEEDTLAALVLVNLMLDSIDVVSVFFKEEDRVQREV